MQASAHPGELRELASSVIWFEPPEKALAATDRFLAYLMEYTTVERLRVARKYFSPADFEHALEHAPPGIMSARSWAYWHVVFGKEPPPLTQRQLP